jgi:hypothetical protein
MPHAHGLCFVDATHGAKGRALVFFCKILSLLQSLGVLLQD